MPTNETGSDNVELTQKTLLLVKPDATHNAEEVLRTLRKNFRLIHLDYIRLSLEAAKRFYAVHKDRPFFDSNAEFMSSAVILAVALEGPDAIAKLRKLVGATDPTKAEPNTLRCRFGHGMPDNGFHASDSPENADRELHFFFPGRLLGDVLD